MGIMRWVAVLQRHRRAMILAALMSTFAGTALVLNPPERTFLAWLGIPLVAGGAAMFVWIVWPAGMRFPEAPPSLASRIIRWATWNGRLLRLFPMLGVVILAADLLYNLKLSATPALQTEDTIAILAASVLIGYSLAPPRFSRERDFVLLFFVWLNAILVVPLLIARIYYADFEASVDVYSWVALAPQTGAVLSLLGVANSVHAVAGSTAPGLTYTPQRLSIQVTVVITTACSGIYSFGIFASAFLAFVLTEYQRMSRRVWMLLGLGLLTAYVANVLRMVVIVLTGFYTDSAETDLQNMLIAHSYAGWIIFLAWLALFWSVILKFLPIEKPTQAKGTSTNKPSHRGIRCTSCHGALTPAISATRCACGAYYHTECVQAAEHCLQCERPVRALSATASQGL